MFAAHVNTEAELPLVRQVCCSGADRAAKAPEKNLTNTKRRVCDFYYSFSSLYLEPLPSYQHVTLKFKVPETGDPPPPLSLQALKRQKLHLWLLKTEFNHHVQAEAGSGRDT